MVMADLPSTSADVIILEETGPAHISIRWIPLQLHWIGQISDWHITVHLRDLTP